MGAPFKLYFSNDIGDPRMPDYKLYVFMNPWSVTAEQRKVIHDKLRKNNATAYWCYAPGYLDGKTFNIRNMKALTGFDFTEERAIRNLKVNFQKETPFAGVPALSAPDIAPVFSVSPGAGTQIVGKDGKYNLAAIRKHNGFTSVWSLLPPNREMLTSLCHLAKVHVYTESNTLLLANDKYIALHPADDAPVTVTLKEKASVCDMLTGKDLGSCKSFVFKPAYKGQTAIYKLKK